MDKIERLYSWVCGQVKEMEQSAKIYTEDSGFMFHYYLSKGEAYQRVKDRLEWEFPELKGLT